MCLNLQSIQDMFEILYKRDKTFLKPSRKTLKNSHFLKIFLPARCCPHFPDSYRLRWLGLDVIFVVIYLFLHETTTTTTHKMQGAEL